MTAATPPLSCNTDGSRSSLTKTERGASLVHKMDKMLGASASKPASAEPDGSVQKQKRHRNSISFGMPHPYPYSSEEFGSTPPTSAAASTATFSSLATPTSSRPGTPPGSNSASSLLLPSRRSILNLSPISNKKELEPPVPALSGIEFVVDDDFVEPESHQKTLRAEPPLSIGGTVVYDKNVLHANVGWDDGKPRDILRILRALRDLR